MFQKYAVATALFTGLLSLTVATPVQARPYVTGHQATGAAKRGVAVWYGEDRNGRLMANGQVFNQWAMTGASVHFPLGTRVRVTDVTTHKHVVVTITDYTIPNSRVLIDLSHGAGKALGIETIGKAHVEVLPIGFDRKYARNGAGAQPKVGAD
jgi:rare lipoprotein A